MHSPHIAIIGGGISGLAAAHRVVELAPQAKVTLFEASQRVGGILETVQRGDYLVERSADMFTTREPWALDLARRVGLADELIGTNEKYRQALIVFRGRLYPVPEGFTLMSPTKLWPIAASPLLSISGKLRMLAEAFVSRRTEPSDESLASFVRRRLGNEAFERLVQPLVGGIYTADPEKLSMAATLPQFVAMEQKHGSLLRAIFRSPEKRSAKETGSGARYGQFLAPRLGMQQLINAIVAKLPADTIRLNTPVTKIERREDGPWSIITNAATETCDAVVYALPGYRAELLRMVDAPLTELVQQVPHAGCSVVVFGFRKQDIAHPLNAFGFVVPAREKRRIIAGSFSSVKFAGRAPEDRVIIRVFVGGALQPEMAKLPDEELIRAAREELAELLGVRGEPEICEVVRWLGVMPQYHVGHVELVDKIIARAATISRFALAGNVYRGVGIPFCIHSGEQAAERIVAEIKT